MSLWNEIVNTALIGCERKAASLNGAADKVGVLLARLDQSDREGALLGAAALASLYERAGTLPLKDTPPLPEACEPGDAPRCGERAAIHLAMMLRGEYRELLPEWMAKTAAAGRRVSEELLPPLLELGQTLELREAILPVLGARGRWLAAQNPDWSYAVGGFDETLWETGNSEQRRAVLAELRKRDTTRARELLASTWSQESPKDRADFLAALENGLSLDDETFLEAALDDRRKEVRGAAADLLARLPESALRRRTLERALPLLKFKSNKLRRKTIEVTLPEACDKAMQRDGVEPKPGFRGVGEKAWWLQQMLGLIPPKVWAQESGWPIDDLIAAAKRGDWKNVLLDGWSQAARLCRDTEWADALLAKAIKEAEAVSLFQVLPQTRQEDFIVELLRADPSLDISKPAYNCIMSCQRQWGKALSRAIIDNLLHHAATDKFKFDSEKTLPIPELNDEVQAAKGFNVIATANNRDRGVNELSSALKRRFNTVILPVPETADEEVEIVRRRVEALGRALELPAEPPALGEIRRIVTVFRELRDGKTQDGKTKLKSPSGTLSTAEAISVVNSGLALAAHFGDGKLRSNDVASSLVGAVVKDPVQDRVVWLEYLETVVKERDGWKDLYRACREVS